ncbi:polymerase [Paenibacillus stellifer]|uniref:Polymerase n=1 Tax=Paenibacillus stellifer TaxID=169760 RepID=A0A089LSD6_9BACL|nr:FapA family protein [Paenibacillus stellifer]AIQ64426.1 polymerase [Paenibacillus stellifer]
MVVHYAMNDYFNISFSDDKDAAYLEFFKREEGFSCTVDEMGAFLEKYNVRFGVQWEIVERFVSHPEEYLSGKVTIAVGRAPQHGSDGRVDLHFNMEADGLKPLEKDDGRVDYKELIRLNNVRKGQLIATLVLPETGEPGMSVTGDQIPAKPGKAARFKVGKNVVVDQEETSMYSAIDGLVSLTDNGKVNVFPLYEVKGDVDYTTGNIDFVGTVVIRGNVLSGFTVKSAGDIRVIGGVEGAELIAGGSIEITGGIIGYNKGIVSAGMDVKVSFVQDGTVNASQDIIVSQSIMHSSVRAGRNVLCNGPKGFIVGGTVQAGEKVVARTIGNTMSTATAIEVGVLPELRNEMNVLRTQLRVLIENDDKTTKALHLLDQLAASGALGPDKVAMRIKLNATKQSQQKELAHTRERILEIEQVLENTDRAKVEVVRTIYGGSKIVIGRYTKFVKDTAERVTFRFSDGDISMSPNV